MLPLHALPFPLAAQPRSQNASSHQLPSTDRGFSFSGRAFPGTFPVPGRRGPTPREGCVAAEAFPWEVERQGNGETSSPLQPLGGLQAGERSHRSEVAPGFGASSGGQKPPLL